MLLKFGQQIDINRFDMTPIIDIVFLLIIFFLLVCQFIVAENFDVTVPDDISSAQPAPAADQQVTTVTVMSADRGGAVYAVGSEIIAADSAEDISYAIAGEIDMQLQHLPYERRVVCLRIDKDICFGDSQYALAGISQSSATDMKLAVTKQKQSPQG
ncbi:MAG: ExbD/TolR family protein [Planctomycetota bacterium]|jgi:biopolymer transport protein ExbD